MSVLTRLCNQNVYQIISYTGVGSYLQIADGVNPHIQLLLATQLLVYGR